MGLVFLRLKYFFNLNYLRTRDAAGLTTKQNLINVTSFIWVQLNGKGYGPISNLVLCFKESFLSFLTSSYLSFMPHRC